MERPVTGVFLAWDDEEIDVERSNAGTRFDHTRVTARRIVTRYALWTNAVTEANIKNAEQYVRDYQHDYDNYRVQVFTGRDGNVRP